MQLDIRALPICCYLLNSGHASFAGRPCKFCGGTAQLPFAPLTIRCHVCHHAGKTQLVKGKLAQLPDDLASLSISFNYFTDVISFQKILESPLEKKVSSILSWWYSRWYRAFVPVIHGQMCDLSIWCT